jgi:hypothetical protein
MSTIAATPEVSVHESSLRPLVLIEARRFVRHPAFLVGLTACVIFTAISAPTASPDVNSGFLAAVFIGVVSMLVTYFQTRSTRSSREALDSSPTSVTQRTAAMCVVCLVPAAFGGLWLASFYVAVQLWPLEPWMYGTFSGADQFAILFGQSIVACLGGPVLGVAAARWLRFRGGALVLVVGTCAIVVAGLLEGWRSSSWNIRMLTPFTFFTDTRINPDAEDSLPGSPGLVPRVAARPLRPRRHRGIVARSRTAVGAASEGRRQRCAGRWPDLWRARDDRWPRPACSDLSRWPQRRSSGGELSSCGSCSPLCRGGRS